MKIVYLFLLCLVYSKKIFCQSTLDFDACLKIALDQDNTYKKQLLQIKIKENDIVTAHNSFYPTLGLISNNNLYVGRQLLPEIDNYKNVSLPNTNINLTSQLYLFKAFQNKLNLQFQKQLLDIHNLYSNQIELEIAFITFTSYIELLYSTDAVELVKTRISFLQLKKEQISYMLKVGSLPKSAIFDIESQINQESINLVNAQKQKNQSYINLKKILNYSINDTFTILQPLSKNELNTENEEKTVNYFTTQFPIILSKSAEIKAYKTNLKLIKYSNFPTLKLTSSLGTAYSKNNRYFENYYSEFYIAGQTVDGIDVLLPKNIQHNYEIPLKNQLINQLGAQFTLQLSIPIINGLSLKQRKNNALLQIKNIEYELDQIKRENQQKISTLYNEYKSTCESIEILTKNLENQNKLLEFYWEKYINGLATNIEYRFAYNNLQQTKAELLHYEYDKLFKQKMIKYYNGVALDLD